MLRRDSDATSLATGESVSRVNSQHDPKTIQMVGKLPGAADPSSDPWKRFLDKIFVPPAWPVLGEAHTILRLTPPAGRAQIWEHVLKTLPSGLRVVCLNCLSKICLSSTSPQWPASFTFRAFSLPPVACESV